MSKHPPLGTWSVSPNEEFGIRVLRISKMEWDRALSLLGYKPPRTSSGKKQLQSRRKKT